MQIVYRKESMDQRHSRDGKIEDLVAYWKWEVREGEMLKITSRFLG